MIHSTPVSFFGVLLAAAVVGIGIKALTGDFIKPGHAISLAVISLIIAVLG